MNEHTVKDPASGATSTTEVARRIPRALVPFTVPAYRRLAVALVFSTFAMGVWIVGLVWQVIRLDGSPNDLSLVTAAFAVAVLVPALLGGVVADRIPQRDILLVVALVELVTMGVTAALAASGASTIWQLATASALIGFSTAFYYPAYSAWLPALVPEQHLMAVNGFEGMVRPLTQQAAGPAVAGFVVGIASPAAAFGIAGAATAFGLVALVSVPRTAVRRNADPTRDSLAAPGDAAPATAPPGAAPPEAAHAPVVRQALGDIREGFSYMRRTPWLLGTLLFASVMVLVVLGPLEVLVPFLLKNELGGGAEAHATVLAAFGIGGAVGSFAMASFPMPRRYLSTMVVIWGVACVPFLVMAVATAVWQVVGAAFVLGMLFSAPTVIWGTLLQRRVPPHLLGRVASLDFFVSLALMPVSMALAGPIAGLVGIKPLFVIAGVVPIVVAIIAVKTFGMPRDEQENPLR